MRASLIAAGAALAALLTPPAPRGAPGAEAVCAACVQATMQALAGEALHGRKCGSPDENAAAQYLAGALARNRIEGALPGGGYLQTVRLLTPTYAQPPTLTLTAADGETLTLTQGQQMIANNPPPALEGDIVRVTDANAPLDGVQGKVVVVDGAAGPRFAQALRAGAALVVAPASADLMQRAADLAVRPPEPTQVDGTAPRPAQPPVVYAWPDAMAKLAGFDGGHARLAAPRGEPLARTSYNVLGVRRGKAADADRQAVLLSAHYDHLGVRGGVVFHGANDDASGTSAVMEFARILGRGAAHRRTVYFALFGCEEEGELGARRFQADPPMPIDDLIANLEFEMIGVDDPKRPGFLMLTGWDRTDLGPTLQAHGAKIGPDLYPEQFFFQRSDNYQLALRGVVAQTISAWPITPTYHAPSDDLAHVDLQLMDRTIGSLVAPIDWLLDADYRPSWNPGKRP